MNVSGSNLALATNATPQQVAGLTNNPLKVPSSIEVTAQPASPISEAPVNPTYDKPIPTSNTRHEAENNKEQKAQPEGETSTEQVTNNIPDNESAPASEDIYSEEELALISSLKSRDAEVNAHERAHAAVGGQHAGSPSYSYKTGPDGVKYAVSGEVSIDTSRVPGDPQATLQKAQQIKAAALAPAEPSGQDRKVAAKADQMASEARSDILESNNGGESSNASQPRVETSAPEHFTGERKFASHNHIDDTTQVQMSERNFHINALYQGSASTISSPSFEAQA